jgi:helicase
MDPTIELALKTIQENKQAIIFCPSRASAEKTAEDIAKLVNLDYSHFSKKVLEAASTPTKQCERLSKIIKKGVAFHHAGLLQEQKSLIEDEFRNRNIKIISATPTLAAGLSLPAFRVIIKSLKRFSGGWGMDWIPVLEYLQMAGRAGRPEYEKFGEAIVIATNEKDKEEIVDRYIYGQPEQIYSKLAVEPVLRTYLLSLISSGIIKDRKSALDFFSKSFWAHQFKDLDKLSLIIDKMIKLLKDWQFVESNQEDFVVASELNSFLKPTMLGKRVSELYLDPLTARKILDDLKNYNPSKNIFSLLMTISYTLEMRPLLRVKVSDKIEEELLKYDKMLLMEEPSDFDPDYNEFLNALKTALFFQSWINEDGEDFLMNKYGIRPGEIRVKLDTADWLLYAIIEMLKINPNRMLEKEVQKLRLRLKYGVKEELLTFLKLKNVGRVRARKLFFNGLKDLGDLRRIDQATLNQILGKKLGESVKEQLGEKVVVIAEKKRKGQMSITKYS